MFTAPFRLLSLWNFNLVNLIKKLWFIENVELLIWLAEKKISNYDAISITFNKNKNTLIVKYVIDWEDMGWLDNFAKSICSKMKTDYLKNTKDWEYKLKNYKCSYTKRWDDKLIVLTRYDDFKIHLRLLWL